MGYHSEAFVGIDTSKLRNAVAIADAGRGGEVRFLGEIENTPAAAQAGCQVQAADVLLRGWTDRLRTAPADQGVGLRMYGGRALADPKAARRQGEDQPP